MTEATVPVSLERRIAAKARGLITEPLRADKEYKSNCEGLPILLRTAGLARAAVFLESKQRQVYEHLEAHLQNLQLLGGSLSQRCTDPRLSLSEYRVLSEMALLAAVWQKRMIQALHQKPQPPAETHA
jgi:hypothetical protein